MSVSKEAIEALEAARAHILDAYRIWQADDVSAVPPPKSGAGAAIAKIDAALSSPIAGEGKVAQLEWRYSEHTSNWYADTPFSQYIAWEISRNAYYLPSISKTPVRAGTTIDEAKAAAQTDYETRILSALISSPGKDGGKEVERDFPAEFEAWWETYRHKNREPADYSVKKQIAFDAFYFAGRPQPASTALVERLAEELTAAASLLETLSEELPDDDVSGVMMRVMAERNRSALSASQSTSREGER